MALGKLWGVFGTSSVRIAAVLMRAQAMHDGMDAHKADYPSPNPDLPTFLGLIQNLTVAEQAVPKRTVGAAAARDVQRDLLWTGMQTERVYVQTLVDANRSRGASLIQNAGLVVATTTVRTKPLLALTLGTEAGTVHCNANVGLLVGVGTLKPHQQRQLNWQYTLDGGKTFVSAGSTPGCKTVITNLPPLTIVGVRVSLTNMHGSGAWSQVVTILTH
jgi:hypothetical protein